MAVFAVRAFSHLGECTIRAAASKVTQGACMCWNSMLNGHTWQQFQRWCQFQRWYASFAEFCVSVMQALELTPRAVRQWRADGQGGQGRMSAQKNGCALAYGQSFDLGAHLHSPKSEPQHKRQHKRAALHRHTHCLCLPPSLFTYYAVPQFGSTEKNGTFIRTISIFRSTSKP